MGKLFLRFTSFILSLGMIVPYGAHAAGVSPGSLELNALENLPQAEAGASCPTPPASPDCIKIKEELRLSAESAKKAAEAYQASDKAFNLAAGGALKASNVANDAMVAQTTVSGAKAAGDDAVKAGAGMDSANGGKAKALENARRAVGRFKFAANAWNGQAPPPTQIAPATIADAEKAVEAMAADLAKSQAEAAAMKANLGKAVMALGALAGLAGLAALGASLLGKKDKGDDKKDKDDDEDDKTPKPADPPATTACGENTVLENGICVVKSADDKCRLANGAEDKDKVRNAEGVCVSKNDLCETGYKYDNVKNFCIKNNPCEEGYEYDKVKNLCIKNNPCAEGYKYDIVKKFCTKNRCSTGYSENAVGECIADDDTNGRTIDPGTPDPLMGDAKPKEKENVSANKVSKKAPAAPSSGTSSGASRSAGSSSGRSAVGGFGAGGGSTGSGTGFGGGGYGGADDKDATEGKDAQVQYNALKWKNPKKEKSLRDAVRKK